MLAALLAQLEGSNPRECAILRELDSLENSLDELLISQSNSAASDPVGKSARVCLHLYNTYTKPIEHDRGDGYLQDTPCGFSLHIRGYEVDDCGNMLQCSEPGVLSRYFRQMMLCTPHRTVLWDRDGIKDSRMRVNRPGPGWSSPSTPSPMQEAPSGEVQCDEYDDVFQEYDDYGSPYDGHERSKHQMPETCSGSDMETAYMPDHMYESQSDSTPVSSSIDDYQIGDDVSMDDRTLSWPIGRDDGVDLGMDDRCGDPGPPNGYDELQIRHICYNDCQVVLYLFPEECTPMCTIPDYLHEFLSFVNGGKPMADSNQQLPFHRVVSMIMKYTYDQSLIYQREDGTYFFMDEALAEVLDRPEGSCMEIHDLPNAVMPHVLPPRPIKIVHDIVFSGDASMGDQFVEIELDNVMDVNGRVVVTDYDMQIEDVIVEIRNALHVKNIYAMYAHNPVQFVEFMVCGSPVDNSKPLTPDVVYSVQHESDSWLPHAIDKYICWYERPVYQVLYGSFNNFSKEGKDKDGKEDTESPTGDGEKGDQLGEDKPKDRSERYFKFSFVDNERKRTKVPICDPDSLRTPDETPTNDKTQPTESHGSDNVSPDMTARSKEESTVEHHEDDIRDDEDPSLGTKEYFSDSKEEVTADDEQHPLIDDNNVIVNDEEPSPALESGASSGSSDLNGGATADSVENSNVLPETEDSLPMNDSAIVDGDIKDEPPEEHGSTPPIMDTTSAVTLEVLSPSRKSKADEMNEEKLHDNMGYTESFSVETHLNMQDNYVAEGSQTMEEGCCPPVDTGGNTSSHEESNAMDEDDDPSSHHPQSVDVVSAPEITDNEVAVQPQVEDNIQPVFDISDGQVSTDQGELKNIKE